LFQFQRFYITKQVSHSWPKEAGTNQGNIKATQRQDNTFNLNKSTLLSIDTLLLFAFTLNLLLVNRLIFKTVRFYAKDDRILLIWISSEDKATLSLNVI